MTTTNADAAMEKALAEARQQEAELDKMIVTAHGETRGDLRDVFDRLCDPDDWKAPIAAYVPHQLVGRALRAIEFFHADTAKAVGIQALTGKVLIQGNGYQA